MDELNLLLLPNELLNIMLNNLPFKTICILSQISKNYYNVIKEQYIMKKYYDSVYNKNVIKKYISSIERIEINGNSNDLDDGELEYITNNGKKIKELIIPNNNTITNNGLKCLKKINLNKIDLSNNRKITIESLENLKDIKTISIFNYETYWEYEKCEYFKNIDNINKLKIKNIDQYIVKYLGYIKKIEVDKLLLKEEDYGYLKNINKLIIKNYIHRGINYNGLKSLLCNKCRNNVSQDHDDSICLQKLITPDNIDNLVDSDLELLKHIKILDIPGSNITINGLMKLKKIEELYLRESRCWSDIEIDYISKSFPNLKVLDIRNNKHITMNSLKNLKLNTLILSSKLRIQIMDDEYEDELRKNNKHILFF